MNNFSKLLMLSFLTIILPLSCFSQDFVYSPVNPAFGGSHFNYSWMLSSANAQNTLDDPARSEDDDENLLNRFTESFNRQFLNEITRQALNTDDLFGEGGLNEGTFEVGDLVVEVLPGFDGITITISDLLTGNQTQLTIPYF